MIRTKRSTAPKQIAGINITPFTDVCLVLLIIFILTSNALNAKKDTGIEFNLPKASNTVVLPATPLIVRVEQGGAIFLNNQPQTLTTLEASLQKFTQYPEDVRPMVTIKADAKSAFGTFVSVSDIVDRNGMKIGIAADQTAKSPEQDPRP